MQGALTEVGCPKGKGGQEHQARYLKQQEDRGAGKASRALEIRYLSSRGDRGGQLRM